MRNLYEQTKNKSLIAIVYFFSFYKQTKDYFEILSLFVLFLSLSNKKHQIIKLSMMLINTIYHLVIM